MMVRLAWWWWLGSESLVRAPSTRSHGVTESLKLTLHLTCPPWLAAKSLPVPRTVTRPGLGCRSDLLNLQVSLPVIPSHWHCHRDGYQNRPTSALACWLAAPAPATSLSHGHGAIDPRAGRPPPAVHLVHTGNGTVSLAADIPAWATWTCCAVTWWRPRGGTGHEYLFVISLVAVANNIKSFRCKALPLRPRKMPQRYISRTCNDLQPKPRRCCRTAHGN